MTTLLSHRGPDAGNTWTDGLVALGHRRLAIIDTSPSGNQPLTDYTGRYHIVFNGEIYNYLRLRRELENKGARFVTGTDTEVILEAYREWGISCLDRFIGMFAFALWDSIERVLFLARDRLGKKPLFYVNTSHGLVFASEVKALLADPRIPFKIDHDAFGQYLSLGYTLTSGCMVQGVRKLPPACWMTVSEKGCTKPNLYWDIVPFIQQKKQYRSVDEAIETLMDLLSDAVKLRMISDVPLGAFLSGGIDSSSVVERMKHLGCASGSGETLTFSIGFHEKGYDEVPEARHAANLFNVSHVDEYVHADMMADLASIAYHADEPFSDTAVIPMFYLAQMARNHVKVALSGDGADELFAGYETCIADLLHQRITPLPDLFKRILCNASSLAPVSHGKVSLDYKLRQFCSGLRHPFARAHYHWRLIFDDHEKALAVCPDMKTQVLAHDPAAIFAEFDAHVSGAHYQDRAMYVDLKTWLVDDILVKVDRATMAHGLEARCPYLDHRIVEFAAGLPPAWKLKGMQKKYILKKTLRGHLPKTILNRKKAGFNSPVSHWLYRNPELLEQAFANNRETPYYNDQAMRELNLEHQNKQKDNSLKLFNFLMFHLWHGTFTKLKASINSHG